MLLNKSIPLLFGTPAAVSSGYAIAISVFFVILSIFGYAASSLWIDFPFFQLLTLLITMHGFTALLSSGVNILFLFRYFLVWILIFVSAFVWALYDGEVKVAPFGVQYQTIENTRILVFAGFLSLCGSLIGWHIAALKYQHPNEKNFLFNEKYKHYTKIVGLIFSVGFSLLYLYKSGGTVISGTAYSTATRDFGFEFGVFNVFHFIGVSLFLIAGVRNNHIYLPYVLIAAATLIVGILTGSRADFLPQLFVLLMLISNKKINHLINNKNYVSLFKWMIVGLFFVLLGYFVASFVAIWRSGIDIQFVIEHLFSSENGLMISDVYGHEMAYLETGNMALGALYSSIVQVNENITGFLFGNSYFNYLLISPPAFLGFPRPVQLDWKTEINGQIMTQGGIFEVAEAYWNFGLVGCFAISALISFCFGWLLQNGLRRNNIFFLMWYMVMGFMSFRAVWYGNFSYFRIMTIMMLIYALAMLFFRWFISNEQKILIIKSDKKIVYQADIECENYGK